MKGGPLPFHYLAVDGPIGVGKTTLAEMLASRFDGVKILEDVGNPFLGEFYEDRPGAAFQTEIYFLLYAQLEPQVPTPDLMLYLVADLDTCMERIRRRQRSVERNIAPGYMAELIDAYNHYYHYYQRTPLLVVDTQRLNFPDRPEDFDELIHRLRQPVRGTEYYVPLGSR